MTTMNFSNRKSMQYTKLNTEFDGNGAKVISVKIEKAVYDAMIDSDFCGFCCPTEEDGIITIAVLSARDGSRWQDVMHDEVMDFLP